MAWNLSKMVGREEAEEVQGALVGAREHLQTVLDVLQYNDIDATDTDYRRIVLMVEDLFVIEQHTS